MSLTPFDSYILLFKSSAVYLLTVSVRPYIYGVALVPEKLHEEYHIWTRCMLNMGGKQAK